MRRVLVWLAVCWLAWGCGGVTEPTNDRVTLDSPELREMFPLSGREWPAQTYRDWWANMERCSGLTGDVGSVRWFTFHDPSVHWFWSPSNRPAGGAYLANDRAIILVPLYVTDQKRVEHEMLHALIGAPGHPPVFATCGVA